MSSSATIPTTKTGDSTAGVTGGTWEAIMNDDPRGQPQSGYRGLIAIVEQGDRYLAIVSDGRAVKRDEWEANARMMAAAPDLYEALKAAEDAMTREDFGTITLLPMIRAALLKARGGQS